MNLADYPDVGKVVDVASAMDCNVKTVYLEIQAGRLEAVHLGRAIRVTRAALLRFLGLASDASPPPPKLEVLNGGVES